MTKDISAIYFNRPITVGGQGMTEWHIRDAVTANARTAVNIDYDRRIAIVQFESGDRKTWTQVPFENVSNVVLVPGKEQPQGKEHKK